MAKRVAVLLSGCGVYDGSEIHEATFTLLALDQAGAEYQCCAPDKSQSEVINHVKGEPANEQRNVLVESARIARGKIVPVTEIKAADFDAIILPGGFGAAKNLCTYAKDGSSMTVDPQVATVLQDFHKAGKAIAAVCIAPVVLASVFGKSDPKVTLTIGTDAGTAGDIETMGATHHDCPVTEFVIDEKNKVITSPAYMLGKGPAEVYEGVKKTVDALLRMV